MKRVETININGIVFSIDDDAYVKLCAYLDTLGGYFKDEQGGREIIADIEARIAELYSERNGGTMPVVSLADVNHVIGTLGTPEDIAGAEMDVDTDTGNRPHSPQPDKSPRRLYRDSDQRYLGGVCSGLAAWLGVAPLIVRLAFVIGTLFYGLSIVVYCVMWIIVPKAATTAQKLEMRGEPVTIDNIAKNIKRDLSGSSLRRLFRNFLDEASEFMNRVFGTSWRIVLILAGVSLCCAGIGMCIFFVCLFFMQDIIFNQKVDWDFLSFNDLLYHIISPLSYNILLVCLLLSIGLLIAAFLFWGIKLITGSKVRYKLLHLALSVVWIMAIITGVVVCISQARNFTWRNDAVVETKQIVPADTLYLAAVSPQIRISNNPIDVYYDKDNHCFYGKPDMRIQKSEDGRAMLKFYRRAQGESRIAAYRYAENIEYQVEIRDSLLTFAPHFTVVPQDKWKFQTLDIVLYIPEGTVIVADEVICDDRTLGHSFRRHRNANCTWVMTKDEGLRPAGN